MGCGSSKDKDRPSGPKSGDGKSKEAQPQRVQRIIYRQPYPQAQYAAVPAQAGTGRTVYVQQQPQVIMAAPPYGYGGYGGYGYHDDALLMGMALGGGFGHCHGGFGYYDDCW